MGLVVFCCSNIGSSGLSTVKGATGVLSCLCFFGSEHDTMCLVATHLSLY